VSYDTVIIGAGLSGLAAGIRLAYFDKRVCIVEKHYTIGGLNSFYRLRKRNHDVGLHAVTNYAEPGSRSGPLSKLLRQLRLRWEDFSLCPQIESSIVFPGRTLRFTNDFQFFRQQVHEQFPQQRDNFEKLLTLIDEHDELHLGSETASARQVLGETISDPVLIDMLLCPLMFYGSPTVGDMDFSQFVIMFKALFYQGFGRPYKGVRLILKNLANHFRRLGGELKLRSGVRQILTDGRQTVGVELESGEILEAKNVLSSAGSAETLTSSSRILRERSLTPKRSSRWIVSLRNSDTTRRSSSTTIRRSSVTRRRKSRVTSAVESSARRTTFSTGRNNSRRAAYGSPPWPVPRRGWSFRTRATTR